MMQNISLKLKKYLERAACKINPIDLAALHATVLSIIIGVFATYFVFINGEIRTQQLEAFSKADEINRVNFKRYAYYLKNEEVFMASGPNDMEGVKKLLGELSVIASMVYGGVNVGKMEIPKDPAIRGERIVGLINVIAHRYPFPKAIDIPSSGGFSRFRPEPIIFTDFEQLAQWLKDLDAVITILKPTTYIMPQSYPEATESYLRALYLREKKKIDGADNLLRAVRGEQNPINIFNDFINGMSRAEKIYNSTLNAFNRSKKLKSNLVSKPYILTLLISGLIIFIVGVALPLLSITTSPLFYIHLPLVYYASFFVIIIFKFWSY